MQMILWDGECLQPGKELKEDEQQIVDFKVCPRSRGQLGKNITEILRMRLLINISSVQTPETPQRRQFDTPRNVSRAIAL